MIMVLVKSTICVLLVFLCAALLSNARLPPSGGEVNEILDRKASVAITSTLNITNLKSQAAIDGNLKKQSANQVVRKGGNAKSGRSVGSKRSLRSRFSHEVDGGFVAFTADYHSVRHHPPKNNK